MKILNFRLRACSSNFRTFPTTTAINCCNFRRSSFSLGKHFGRPKKKRQTKLRKMQINKLSAHKHTHTHVRLRYCHSRNKRQQASTAIRAFGCAAREMSAVGREWRMEAPPASIVSCGLLATSFFVFSFSFAFVFVVVFVFVFVFVVTFVLLAIYAWPAIFVH